MTFYHQTLPNGLEILGETNPAVHSVALGFFVRTGARDEPPELAGVSHFLEHMVFKGTERRTALQVNADFDRIGADYNAFTSEENTVFHAAVLPEYLPQVVDILADILRPSLREEDFRLEKEVILNEIGMYEDRPGYAAYDQAKQLYFGKHPLGRRILGTRESIQSLKRQQMYEYFSRHYVANNILVAAAGNFSWEEFVHLVEHHCGSWPSGPRPRRRRQRTRGTAGFAVQPWPREKVSQEYVYLISEAPPARSPGRYAADLVATVLGDDTGSRLYWALVDPGRAESADASFHEYEDTGAYYLSLCCAPEQTASNLALVQKVLRQLQEKGVSATELQAARNKVLARLVRANEVPLGRLSALGMGWIYERRYRSLDEELQAFEAVTLARVHQVLERYPFDQVTIFALGPLAQLRRPRSRPVARA
jgi:predicted Zn-dependent peptidase